MPDDMDERRIFGGHKFRIATVAICYTENTASTSPQTDFSYPQTMSIGATMRATSPNHMEDVELGSSSSANKSGTARTRPMMKLKDSNIVELQPLVEPSSKSSKGDGESSSFAKSVIASTMYSGCSIGMVLVNKSLASR